MRREARAMNTIHLDRLLRLPRRTPELLLICGVWLAAFAAFTDRVSAQRTAEGEFKPGDKVEIDFGGNWQPAVVVEVKGPGLVRVKTRVMGREIDPVFPTRLIRPARGAEARVPAAKRKPKPDVSAPRTWTDSTGKYKVEASLVELKDGQVTLKKPDGQVVAIPLERLSEADQQFVREATSEGEGGFAVGQKVEVQWGLRWFPASIKQKRGDEMLIHYEGWSDNFDEWVTAARVRLPGSGVSEAGDEEFGVPGEPASTATEVPITEADWSGAVTISPGQPPPEWSLEPDGLPAADARPASKPIRLTGNLGNIIDQPTAILFSDPEDAQAVVVHVDRRGAESNVRLERCDLREGRMTGAINLGAELLPLALSPNGEYLLSRSEKFGIGTHDRLDVWSIAGEEPQHVISWKPYEGDGWADRDVEWAGWVDAGHVLTLSKGRKLVLWEAAKARAVYCLDVTMGCRPALSPGRSYVVVATTGGVEVYDPLSGRLTGRLAEEAPGFAQFSFSPDGRSLAVASHQRLQVWEWEPRRLWRDIAVPAVAGSAGIDWTSDGYILLRGVYLVDLDRRIVLWEYKRSGTAAAEAGGLFGGLYWYVAMGGMPPGQLQQVVPVELPHPEARRVAEGLDPDSLLAIKPGVRVSLEINVQASPDERRKIAESLTSRLEKNGVTVAPGQPIKLVARTAPGETQQIEYSEHIGFNRPVAKVSVTDKKCELAFVVNGRTAWQSQAVFSAPHFLRLKEGQSVQQAVNELVKYDLRFFHAAPIPSHVVRPTGKTSYGASQLTDTGVAPVGRR